MDESSFDVQLLLTSISVAGVKAPSPPSPNTPAAALEQLRSGTFLRALQTSLSHLSLPSHCTTTPECAAEWFQAVETATQAIIAAKHSNPEHMRWLLLTAVAALYTFTQANLTGPSLHAPENPFELLSEDWNGTANGATSTGATGTAEDAHSDPGFGRDSMSPEDLWATVQLAENGEDLVGRIHNPQYLLLAVKVLLIAVPNSAAAGQVAPAWSWWGARATLLQQRVLVGRSAVLRERLVYLIEHAVDAFAPSDGDLGQPGATLRHALAAAVLLEAATMETAYGHVGPAKEYTHRAAAVLGVEAELTGALGVRTVHQQDPRAQLILKIHQSNTTGAREEGAEGPFLDPAACGEDAALLDAALTENSGTGEEVKGLADESDVLRHPKLIAQPDASNDSTAGDGSAPAHLPALSPLHQAVLLAMCTNVKKGTASDGLQPWEVAAHADAVLQQGRGEFLLRTAAHLQLSRLERGRARTRERALLTLEGLAEGIDAAGGVPPEARMR